MSADVEDYFESPDEPWPPECEEIYQCGLAEDRMLRDPREPACRPEPRDWPAWSESAREQRQTTGGPS